ncbi:hypothetical protein [Clostridium uliginosum]|uniref:Carboxypeptidase regulatory-like domain-containing protein n=1 Tax=Clostridium uliginosum TaxID=119641 RepID=A0A1I1HFB6_9CLOT|nr:hypothetical protein [Clostridium uliginosum]SFC22697.1 hypothetical protein SAMN05421842_101291 [Clostridium uliginosum]
MYSNICGYKNKFNRLYLTGKVKYSDGELVSNAIIIVEKIINCYKRYYIGYAITDIKGDFIIEVKDRNAYYKLTAFDCNLKGISYMNL